MFISHNLGAVRHVSDRVAVMYLGRIVEIGSEDDIFERPAHPYTIALIEAIPEPDPDQAVPPPLVGRDPEPARPAVAAATSTRAVRAPRRVAAPRIRSLRPRRDGHQVRCHFPS